jgi:hypothetical protein
VAEACECRALAYGCLWRTFIAGGSSVGLCTLELSADSAHTGGQRAPTSLLSLYCVCVLQAQELSGALGGPLLVSKGQVDVLTDGASSLVVTADGSPRRCGGQGDVLTGGC